MDITHIKVPQWENYKGLLYGFMGRTGGKSAAPYAGLNASYRVGDDPKVVSQNGPGPRVGPTQTIDLMIEHAIKSVV